MKHRIASAIWLVNLPHVICRATIGKHHTRVHRMVWGVIIMASGVAMVKIGGSASADPMVHYLLDVFGYAAHGLGLAPFAETWVE